MILISLLIVTSPSQVPITQMQICQSLNVLITNLWKLIFVWNYPQSSINNTRRDTTNSGNSSDQPSYAQVRDSFQCCTTIVTIIFIRSSRSSYPNHWISTKGNPKLLRSMIGFEVTTQMNDTTFVPYGHYSEVVLDRLFYELITRSSFLVGTMPAGPRQTHRAWRLTRRR